MFLFIFFQQFFKFVFLQYLRLQDKFHVIKTLVDIGDIQVSIHARLALHYDDECSPGNSDQNDHNREELGKEGTVISKKLHGYILGISINGKCKLSGVNSTSRVCLPTVPS